MFFRRHQDLWKIRTNNSCLLTDPQQRDVKNIYSFCEHFNDRLSEFVFACMEMSKVIRLQEQALIVDTEENLSMIIEILKEQKFIFLDIFSQIRGSYKGYVSWLLIGTHSRMYLIDAARLHDQCYGLKEVLERKDLIKFMHECQQVVFALKRDWSIFVPNIFDLEVIQRFLVKKGKANIQPKAQIKEFFCTSSSLINNRPLKQNTIRKLQEYYESEISIMMNLDKFFTIEDPEYQCYAYFNHYEFLLKSYFHHTPQVRQMDELERIRRGANAFARYGNYQEIVLEKQRENGNLFWIKEPEEEEMAQMLCEWREHIAKMRDINVQEVLSYETVSLLVKSKINSILQISQICSPSQGSAQGIYFLSLQQFEQIFELFQLYKEQKEESSHELVIPRRFPFFKPNEQKPIKELFEELKFTDVGNDWLNKKTDDSIRLYKEIVSINEFDNSIVQEYMKEITADKNTSSLSVENINRYVKYAEYLRLGNHKRLQELYEKSRSQNVLAPSSNQEEYFQENFIQGQQYKNWQEIEEELNFPTMDTINLPKSNESLTSLKSLTNLNIQSCKNFTIPKSTSVLKEKKLNSLNLLESPSIFCKIEPLPENIEAIYLEAAKAKKNYSSKGQKKTNKVNKKQSKTKIEANSKKEEQFVPKKEEIFNLIYY